ncbi:MAG TPA: SDR family NAD(P)-dependent oxidoreductase, partial [Terrimicrobiaceae bacterium]|nr:SDR family NAD(P)-dependent oxidoreductase [Terrimicrobiaceae bacterium]
HLRHRQSNCTGLFPARRNVVVSGRRVSEGENVVREITSAGGKALFVQTDVGREEDIIALIEKTVATVGALHIAFNNAGSEGHIGLLTTEQTVEHYRQVCDINICGVVLSMKHEIRSMLRSGGGAIVNTSSVGGHVGFPGASVYVASKFAVIGLTKTAALEFAKDGIRVNSVSPGPIQTEMFDRAFGEGQTDTKKLSKRKIRLAASGRRKRSPARSSGSVLRTRPSLRGRTLSSTAALPPNRRSSWRCQHG